MQNCRLWARRFPELETTQTGILVAPQARILTRIVSLMQVFGSGASAAIARFSGYWTDRQMGKPLATSETTRSLQKYARSQFHGSRALVYPRRWLTLNELQTRHTRQKPQGLDEQEEHDARWRCDVPRAHVHPPAIAPLPLRATLATLLLLTTAPLVRASILDMIQTLRSTGCNAIHAPQSPLHRDERLDSAARRWAQGETLRAALADGHYIARSITALHVTGDARSAAETLRQSHCETLGDPTLRDIGVYRRDPDTWLVFAGPYALPTPGQAPRIAAHVVALTNMARAHHQRCGPREFAATTPLSQSIALDHIALSHATDMAEHHYFDHQDRAHHSPAERVRAAGYRESLVGENIAYGPDSAEEVVRGWLASPAHCENLMTPGFTEIGIAFATGTSVERPALYWVQLLAKPLP